MRDGAAVRVPDGYQDVRVAIRVDIADVNARKQVLSGVLIDISGVRV